MLVALGLSGVWPLWMEANRRLLTNRLYFAFRGRLRLIEVRAVFGGVFYLLFGVAFALALWAIDPVSVRLLPSGDFASPTSLGLVVAEVIGPGILLFAASLSLSLTVIGLWLAGGGSGPRGVSSASFEGSWVEVYLRQESAIGLLGGMLFPVIAEELVFRLILVRQLFELFPAAGVLSSLATATVLGTVLFVLQQWFFLKNWNQRGVVGVGAVAVGLVNSSAYLLGASAAALVLSHLLYATLYTRTMRRANTDSYRSVRSN